MPFAITTSAPVEKIASFPSTAAALIPAIAAVLISLTRLATVVPASVTVVVLITIVLPFT